MVMRTQVPTKPDNSKVKGPQTGMGNKTPARTNTTAPQVRPSAA